MADDPEGWRRLGERVRRERSPTWRRREDFAAACGLKVSTLSELERGVRGNFSPETIAVVEARLGWPPGSAVRIRDDLELPRRRDPGLARITALWPRLSPGWRALVVELVERAAAGR